MGEEGEAMVCTVGVVKGGVGGNILKQEHLYQIKRFEDGVTRPPTSHTQTGTHTRSLERSHE